jgi:hypothetical protein
MRRQESTLPEQSLQSKFLTAVPRRHVLEMYFSPVMQQVLNSCLRKEILFPTVHFLPAGSLPLPHRLGFFLTSYVIKLKALSSGTVSAISE